MKVFASRFLEQPHKDSVIEAVEWSWQPEQKSAYRIFASGASTNTKESTYAAEKDSRSDSDRPNEGSLVA